jgi:hypothetical protein
MKGPQFNPIEHRWTNPTNELDLFAAAIADPSERAALLERECAGSPELRLRLDRLLEEHSSPDPWLDRPGLDRTAALPATATGNAGAMVQYERAGIHPLVSTVVRALCSAERKVYAT